MSGQVGKKLPAVSIPGLKELPVIGTLVYRTVPISFLSLLVLCSELGFFMYRTKAGLRLRAIGDHPQAAQTVGINVSLYRYVAVTFLWNVVRACRWLSFHRAKQLICKRNGCRPGIHGIGRNDSRWVESFWGSVRKPCICICTGIEN